MSNTVTPVVLSDDKQRHEPMRAGDVLPVASIPVSPDKSNLLEAPDDGLLLTGESLISGQVNNPLDASVDGKLYVKTDKMIAADDKVLGICDNVLFTELSLAFNADDSKLSLLGKGGAVISEASLMLKLDTSTIGNGLDTALDGRVYVDMKSLVNPDTGLVVGPDGRLGIDLDKLAELLADKISHPVSADDDNILTSGSDGKPFLSGDRGSL